MCMVCFDALQVCKTSEERREERRGVQFRADWYADIRELAEQVCGLLRITLFRLHRWSFPFSRIERHLLARGLSDCS